MTGRLFEQEITPILIGGSNYPLFEKLFLPASTP
jgi:hypothetical protein